jgi:bifunctional non-homologous end joining protein LigD
MTALRPQPTQRKRAQRSTLPEYKPQLATLVTAAPSGEGWVHEIKYDGYRIGCFVDAGAVRLMSRNGKDWTAKFPELVAACRQLAVKNALLDGEVVIVLPEGRSSFQALQNSFSGGSRQGLSYFVFDLLFVDGVDLRDEALCDRKQRLRGLVPKTSIIKYSEDLAGDGAEILANACKLGLEGIVSKRVDRPHRSRRSEEWLKTKCSRRQEFVVGGFTDPSGARAGVGALLLGYYEGQKLLYAGKVGTGKGFTASYLEGLRSKLDKVERERCPYAERPPTRALKGVHWVEPVHIVEVSFAEWTDDKQIRHASLLGFRDDKRPENVSREVAKPVRKGKKRL